MRVLVCGGRNYHDEDAIRKELVVAPLTWCDVLARLSLPSEKSTRTCNVRSS